MPAAKFPMIDETIQFLLPGCKYSADCQGNPICPAHPIPYLLLAPPLAPRLLTATSPLLWLANGVSRARTQETEPFPGIGQWIPVGGWDFPAHCVLPQGVETFILRTLSHSSLDTRPPVISPSWPGNRSPRYLEIANVSRMSGLVF